MKKVGCCWLAAPSNRKYQVMTLFRFPKVSFALSVLAMGTGVLLSVSADGRTPSAEPITEIRERAKATAQSVAEEATRRGIPLQVQTVTGEPAWLSGFVNGRPIYDAPLASSSAVSINVHRAQAHFPAPAMDDQLIIGVWDGGNVRLDHPELVGRVTNFEDPEDPVSSHATSVAGVVASTGVDPAVAGILPLIQVHAYDLNEDLPEMTERAAVTAELTGDANILVSNHSYGEFVGWSQARIEIEPDVFWQGWFWFGDWPEREDRRFGQYTERARDWDALCHGAPFFLPVRASGNDRTEGFLNTGTSFRYWDAETESWILKSFDPLTDPFPDNWNDGGFDTIGTFANAKNILTVGAVTFAVSSSDRLAESARMTSFGSWGPSDDGRIKPDLVAVGALVMTLWGTPPSLYASGSGTSFSAPSTAGAALLLQAMHRQATGLAMVSSTVKALLIHTATDIGNPGPDYQYGWGLVDASSAADVLDQHIRDSAAGVIHVEPLANEQTFTHSFQWNGHSPIRATLSWTDPPGPIRDGLNDPTPVLVNDLDLRIINPDGETIYQPFILDGQNPELEATVGDNLVDNVEQILIEAPVEGEYLLTVSHKGILDGGEQRFTLVLTGQELPGLNVVPLGLHRNLHIFGEEPPQFAWTLRNTTTAALSWQVEDVPDWLAFDGESGTIPAEGSLDVTATLDPQSSGFSPAVHEARIRFRDVTTDQYRNADVVVDAWRAITPTFEDDFESGTLADTWRVTGVGQHRATVREILGPLDSWHLVMDDYLQGAAWSRIEVTTLLDVVGWTDLQVSFDTKSFHTVTGGPHANPYLGGAWTNGIALSADGHLWHEVFPLREENISLTYTPRAFDLDVAMGEAGLLEAEHVFLRFSTFARNTADAATNMSGIAIDNISITGILKLGDSWSIH
jgi:hypothetical protein